MEKKLEKFLFALICALTASSLFWITILISQQMQWENVKSEYSVFALIVFLVTIGHCYKHQERVKNT